MSAKIDKYTLYTKLRARIEAKIAPSKGSKNILPPVNCDLKIYFDRIIPVEFPEPANKQRRDYENQWIILQHKARGKPLVIAFNMLLISYLRRETEHTTQAKSIYFRLWEEFGFELLEIIPTRDLISAIRAFADHADDPAMRLRAKMAFTYAHLIKLYESERKVEGGKLWRANYKVPGGCPKIGIPDLWGALLGGDNSFEIIHVLLAEEIEEDEIIGPMILTLLARIQEGKTLFSRHDRARLGSKYNLESDREWSFGFNPDEFDHKEPSIAENQLS